MLLKVYEESKGDVGVGGKALRRKVNFWNVWLLNVFLNVVRKGLNCGSFRESNVLCAFLRLHISDAVWPRLTCVFCAVPIHCLWRVC